jgi:branched-chain amino acid transport system permease protein
MGFAGQVSLTQAAFYGIGAYTSAILTTHYHFSPIVCLIIGLAISSLISVLIGAPALRLRGHYLGMSTLASGIIVYIFFREAKGLTNGPTGIAGVPDFSVFGFVFDSRIKYYILIWSLALIIILLTFNIIHSRIGRALRSISTSELAAATIGINIAKYKILVFFISAIYASLAGSLYGHFMNYVNPTPFSLFVSLQILIMVVVGGHGSVWGALIGASLLTVLPEYLRALEDFDVLIYGVILMLTMVLLPNGLVSLFSGEVSNRVRKLIHKLF